MPGIAFPAVRCERQTPPGSLLAVIMRETPWFLDHDDRVLALRAILTVCDYRACSVVTGEVKPERMMCDFKAYATRALRPAHPEWKRKRFWTEHGSTRYLWDENSLRAAVTYVLHGQGEPMACYPEEAASLVTGFGSRADDRR